MRQLHTYSDPRRDPRGIVHTTAFLAISAGRPEPTGGSDADSADWVEIEPTLPSRPAFDHADILNDAVTEIRRYRAGLADESGQVQHHMRLVGSPPPAVSAQTIETPTLGAVIGKNSSKTSAAAER